jgi:hypothetical protein
MLEQPPERSQAEVEAEAAALAAQAAPQRRVHGCYRVIIWCMPTVVLYVIFMAVAAVLTATLGGVTVGLYLTVSLLLTLGITFTIGFFDGFFTNNTSATSPELRQKEISHAGRFTLIQIGLIPTLTLIPLGMFVIFFKA